MDAIVAVITTAFSGGAGLSTGLALASTAVSGISSIAQNKYQATVLARAAKTEQENAARIRAAGAQQAQQQDVEAREIIEGEIARMGASGFAIDSFSSRGRIAKNRRLSSIDRQRIVEDAELQAKSSDNQANAYIAEAKQAKRASIFDLIGIGIGAGTDLVSGANLVNKIKSARITNSSRTVY
jgi:hypothetical protein